MSSDSESGKSAKSINQRNKIKTNNNAIATKNNFNKKLKMRPKNTQQISKKMTTTQIQIPKIAMPKIMNLATTTNILNAASKPLIYNVETKFVPQKPNNSVVQNTQNFHESKNDPNEIIEKAAFANDEIPTTSQHATLKANATSIDDVYEKFAQSPDSLTDTVSSLVVITENYKISSGIDLKNNTTNEYDVMQNEATEATEPTVSCASADNNKNESFSLLDLNNFEEETIEEMIVKLMERKTELNGEHFDTKQKNVNSKKNKYKAVDKSKSFKGLTKKNRREHRLKGSFYQRSSHLKQTSNNWKNIMHYRPSYISCIGRILHWFSRIFTGGNINKTYAKNDVVKIIPSKQFGRASLKYIADKPLPENVGKYFYIPNFNNELDLKDKPIPKLVMPVQIEDEVPLNFEYLDNQLTKKTPSFISVLETLFAQTLNFASIKEKNTTNELQNKVDGAMKNKNAKKGELQNIESSSELLLNKFHFDDDSPTTSKKQNTLHKNSAGGDSFDDANFKNNTFFVYRTSESETQKLPQGLNEEKSWYRKMRNELSKKLNEELYCNSDAFLSNDDVIIPDKATTSKLATAINLNDISYSEENFNTLMNLIKSVACDEAISKETKFDVMKETLTKLANREMLTPTTTKTTTTTPPPPATKTTPPTTTTPPAATKTTPPTTTTPLPTTTHSTTSTNLSQKKKQLRFAIDTPSSEDFYDSNIEHNVVVYNYDTNNYAYSGNQTQKICDSTVENKCLKKK